VTKTYSHYGRYTLMFLVAVAIIVSSFYFADKLQSNEVALEIVQSYGHVGILTVAIIGGLNVIVPVPAGVFTPIFTEAGFSLITIISLLVLGTVIADLIGYGLGRFGRVITATNPPKLVVKIESFIARRPTLVIPVMTLYAAFAPLPNEILLIPLGFAGYRLTYLIPALIVGNIVHQLILVFGVDSIFNLIF